MLPSYDLFIPPTSLAELRKDIWRDQPVSGKLTYEKRKYHIHAAYRGSHIRELAKKSYHLSFLQPHTFFGAHEVHLNAELIDRSIIRNKLSLDFFQEIGTLAPSSQHVLLKINGKSQGIYLQLESVDEYFLKKRGLPNGHILYAVDDDANFSLVSEIHDDVKKTLAAGYEVKCGGDKALREVSELVYKVNTLSRIDYEKEIVKYVDVEQYLRWLAAIVCIQNFDGFVRNYALYQDSESGQFQIIPWDCDATWGRNLHGKPMRYDYVRIEGYNTLSARLLDVPAFRKQYALLLKRIIEEKFTVEYIKPQIEELYTLLQPYVKQDPYMRENMDLFDEEQHVILQYVENRNGFLREQVKKLV